EKSAVGGVTVITRAGGLGSLFPLPSMAVSEAVYVPGVSNRTAPGLFRTEFDGDPPGKIHEYCAALLVVLEVSELPAAIVVSAAGDVITPLGGVVVYGVSWMNCATEGTPRLSTRNSM